MTRTVGGPGGAAVWAVLGLAACGGAPWEPSWEGTYVGTQEAVDAQGVGQRRPGRVVLQRATWGADRNGTLLRNLWDLEGCVVVLRRVGDGLAQDGAARCHQRERRVVDTVETVVEFRWTLDQAQVTRGTEDAGDRGDDVTAVAVEARLSTQQVQVAPDGTESTVEDRVERVTFGGARVGD